MNLAWNVNWFFWLDKSKPNMSRNLYMNLYVQQIFNEEPCKNDWVIQLTTFVFPMPCRKEKHGIFFSQWSHFRGIIDVRHFVGFLFRRYGKKQFSRQFTFLKFVLESLQDTELVTWHISWTIPSINLMLADQSENRIQSPWSRDKLSALQKF